MARLVRESNGGDVEDSTRCCQSGGSGKGIFSKGFCESRISGIGLTTIFSESTSTFPICNAKFFVDRDSERYLSDRHFLMLGRLWSPKHQESSWAAFTWSVSNVSACLGRDFIQKRVANWSDGAPLSVLDVDKKIFLRPEYPSMYVRNDAVIWVSDTSSR